MERVKGGWRTKRLWRAALLASTCLPAIALAPRPARAQTSLAASATPQGGTVAAGAASIAQAPGSTTITQTSQRTAIDWQSFNIGSAAQVQFVQPSSSAIALNRVITPAPSVIAGKLDANGQVVLINQSGVVFTKGSQVNAESIVVSTSNVANADFMAGKLNFTGAPHPGAKIINDGDITVKDTGLVGLVAPQVANNGVITAKLGQVVLAGADAFTLDLYGDRLISLDVTKAVTAVDVGGKAVPALVTNSGVIIADGGSVTLTAQDADALVTQLIDAGGTIRADSLGAQTGTISIAGVGGDISIAGNLLAQGTQSGTKGGSVAALTTGTVSVAPTAVIDASGAAGGGDIAIGTDLARATQGAADTAAPRAAAVVVAPGAALRADATANGNAGKVVLLSSKTTDFGGTISVQGGALGGNGGIAEISSDGVISLGGTVFDTALDGQSGEILLDPATLIVSTAGTPTTGSTASGGETIFGTDTLATSYIAPSAIDSLTGTIVLEASSLLSVASELDVSSASVLSLTSAGAVTISAPISLTSGVLHITAATQLFVGDTLSAPDIELVDSGAAIVAPFDQVTIGAPISFDTALAIVTDDGLSILPTGSVIGNGVIGIAPYSPATNLTAIFPADFFDSFNAPTLDIGQASSFTASELLINGDVSFGNEIDLQAANVVTQIGTVTAGQIAIGAPTIALGGMESSASALDLSATTSLDVTGTVNAGALDINGAGFTQSGTAGPITATLLEGMASSPVLLTGTANEIGTLGGFNQTSGSFALDDLTPLTIAGPFDANDASLSAPSINVAGTVNVPDLLTFDSSGSIDESPGGAVSAGTITDGVIPIYGDLNLGQANSVSALGNLSLVTGDLILNDVLSLDIVGAVSSATLTLEGSNFGQGAGAGPLTANELDGNASGDVLLLNTLNAVGTLGNLTVTGGNFALFDALPLDVVGTVSANNISLTDASPAGITLGYSGSLVANGGGNVGLYADNMSLYPGSTIIAPGGYVTLAPFTSTLGTDLGGGDDGLLDLTQSNLDEVSSNLLQIGTGGGTVEVESDISSPAGTFVLDGNGITLAANLYVPGELALISGGTVSEGSEVSLYAGTLTTGNGAVAGGLYLTNNYNDIPVLGNATVGGALDLQDDVGLTLTGAVTAQNAMLTAAGGLYVPGSIYTSGPLYLISNGRTNFNDDVVRPQFQQFANGPGLTITGYVSAGSVLSLSSNNGIYAYNGRLAAQTLAGYTRYGNVELTGNNNIATLGSFGFGTNTVYFGLNDTAPLNIISNLAAYNISISAPNIYVNAGLLASNGVTLSAAYGIGLNAQITAGQTLALYSNGNVAQPQYGAGITAPTLAGSIGGIASLISNENTISYLGSFTGGNIDLVDSVSLATGSVSVGAAYLSAPSVTFTNNFGASGVLQVNTPNVITQTNGTVSAGTLTSGAYSDGGVFLTNAGDAITTLGGFTVGTEDSINLYSSAGLTVAGPVNASYVRLRAPSITFTGYLTANELYFTNSGPVYQTSGAINSNLLSTGESEIVGGVSLGSSLNVIGTLQNIYATGNFSVVNATSLTVDNLGAPNISLTASSVYIAGSLGTGILAITSAGNVTESPNATVNASTLSTGAGSVGGGIYLTNAYNNISLIGNATVGGALNAVDQLGLTLAGAISAASASLAAPGVYVSGSMMTQGALYLASGSDDGNPGITITGSAAAGTVLSLSSAYGIYAAAGGLTAAILTGSIGLGNAQLTGNNAIGTLGNFDVPQGSLALSDGAPLTVAGDLSASSGVTLSGASGIALDGPITAGPVLALYGAGNVTQGGGDINANTLTGSLAGEALLTGGGNTIGLVTNYTGGTLDLVDQTALTAGPLTATAAALTAPDITLSGDASITGALALSSPGGIVQSSGTLAAGTLTSGGATDGNVTLADAGDAIATLGGFTVGTGDALELQDASALTVAGPVSGPVISLGAASMGLAGNITATDLTLSSPLSIDQTAGSISAESLSGGGETGGSDVLLGQSGNSITNLGDIVLNGDFVLTDAVPATISGLLQAPSISLSGPSLALDAYIGASTELDLASSGDVTEGALADVDAGALATGSGGVAGNLDLANATNSITVLGAAAVGGALTLNDAAGITLAGPLTAGQAAITAPGITITGYAGVGTVLSLSSAGDIQESGGTLVAPTLTGSAATSVSLTGQNSIGVLSGLTASAGNIALIDAVPLTIAGDVTADTANISAPSLDLTGTVLGGTGVSLTGGTGITLDGLVSTGSTLALYSAGNVSQTGGNLTAAALAGSLTGTAGLTAGTNHIGILADFNAAGLQFTDQSALTVQSLSAATADLSAPGIQLTGNVSASAGLTLVSGSSISQTGGAISTSLLSGMADAGGASLISSGNQIGTLGGFTVTGGDLALADANDLTIAGPVSAPGIGLDAPSFTVAGNLSTGILDLAGGGLNQTSGTLTVTTLTTAGTLTGAVSLAGPANLIGTLDGFAAGPLTLTDAAALTVAGTVSAPSISLTDTAAGINLRAGGGLAAGAGGSIGITSDDLTGVSGAAISAPGGTIALAPYNAGLEIDLGGTGGGFFDVSGTALADSGAAVLQIGDGNAPIITSGAFTAAAGTLLLDGAGINFGGSLDVPGLLELASLSGITQNAAGVVTAGTLISAGSIVGNVDLSQAANNIGTLGAFTVNSGGFALNDAGSLALTGPLSASSVSLTAAALTIPASIAAPQLALSAGSIAITGVLDATSLALAGSGNVTESGPGAITAATLSSLGTIGGNLTLEGTSNTITSFGNLAAAGDVLLADTAPVALGGTLTAGGTLGLASLGAITQSAGVVTAPVLDAVATGISLGDANRIGTLGTVTTGNLLVAGLGGTTGQVSASQTTLTSPGDLALGGNVSATGALDVTAAGDLTQTGDITAPTATLSGASIALSGTDTVTGAFDATATGALTQTGAILAQGATLSGASIALSGTDTVTGALDGTATGALSQTGAVTAQGARFTAANIALSGTDTISGLFDLAASGGVSQSAGAITASAETIDAASIALAGSDNVTGLLDLAATGTITSTGTLAAGTLTGTAGSLASFGGVTDIGTLGSFVMNDSAFSLSNTGNLTISGPVVADVVNIGANGTLILNGAGGGALFISGTLAANAALSPGPGDSTLTGTRIVELGTFYVNAGPYSSLYNSPAVLGSSNTSGTLFLSTTLNPQAPGGNIVLAQAPGGLYAPSIDLVLSAGTNGAISGNINVYHLEILSGASAMLTGFIDGLTGPAAAADATFLNGSASQYQFNACVIGSQTCTTQTTITQAAQTVLTINPVSILQSVVEDATAAGGATTSTVIYDTAPLENFSTAPRKTTNFVLNVNPEEDYDTSRNKRRRLDKNIELPGIATHDY